MAASTAWSSTMPARAKFRITTPGRMMRRRSALTRCRVVSPSGTCRLRKSTPLTRASMPLAFCTPADSCHAPATLWPGSKPITRTPRDTPMLATRRPTAPRPRTPRVRPGSSRPAKRLLASSTWTRMAPSSPRSCRAKSHAWQILRQARSMPASTSSFTALAFAPGALNTGMPRALNRSTGILFTPAPARATALGVAGVSRPGMWRGRSGVGCGVRVPAPAPHGPGLPGAPQRARAASPSGGRVEDHWPRPTRGRPASRGEETPGARRARGRSGPGQREGHGPVDLLQIERLADAGSPRRLDELGHLPAQRVAGEEDGARHQVRVEPLELTVEAGAVEPRHLDVAEEIGVGA